jgi:hypothetical protein
LPTLVLSLWVYAVRIGREDVVEPLLSLGVPCGPIFARLEEEITHASNEDGTSNQEDDKPVCGRYTLGQIGDIANEDPKYRHV